MRIDLDVLFQIGQGTGVVLLQAQWSSLKEMMGKSAVINCCAETCRSKISFCLFSAVSQREMEAAVEMPGVRGGVREQDFGLLARLNQQAKSMRSERIKEREEREREMFAERLLGTESGSSIEEVEVVPPSPSRFLKYLL